jgi:glycosyltransferase involved in cell wall biosynthesis
MAKVAAIIPAYNEARRIATVARAAVEAALISEVIVVDDGSVDDTATVSGSIPGVRVLRLRKNRGKGAAMAAGVAYAAADVVVFVDADLDGLRSEHIDQLVRPILNGGFDMCLGVFHGGRVWSDAAQRITPQLTGQRALRRELFDGVPAAETLGLGIEVALNREAKRRGAKVARVILRGVSNCHKEQKLGLVRGAAARAKMYAEIGQAIVKGRYSG